MNPVLLTLMPLLVGCAALGGLGAAKAYPVGLCWLDQHAALTEYLTELAACRREQFGAAALAREQTEFALAQQNTVDEMSATIADLRNTIDQLTEPGEGGCNKVRLRDRAEADQFAVVVGKRTGELFSSYRCKFCPRQPLSNARFWHITHLHATERGQHPPKPAEQRRAPAATPADVARLHQKHRSA